MYTPQNKCTFALAVQNQTRHKSGYLFMLGHTEQSFLRKLSKRPSNSSGKFPTWPRQLISINEQPVHRALDREKKLYPLPFRPVPCLQLDPSTILTAPVVPDRSNQNHPPTRVSASGQIIPGWSLIVANLQLCSSYQVSFILRKPTASMIYHNLNIHWY